MEWIRDHIGWLLPAVSTVIGAVAWLLRLEARVASNSKSILGLEAHPSECPIRRIVDKRDAEVMRLEELILKHLADETKHQNGKTVEKLERKLDKVSDEVTDTRKSLELSFNEGMKELRGQVSDLFDKLYEQKR